MKPKDLTPPPPPNNLCFFTNELQNPNHYKQLNLPFEFITFGITEGKMYKHFRNQGTFIAPADTRGKWGNTVVYGGLFYCQDIEFYLRILDAYHVCSLSTLYRNHIKDIHHRHIKDITPIYFDTLEQLAKLQYKEGEAIKANTYIGNTEHPRLARRILPPEYFISYRITDGIEAKHFKSLFGEVRN